MKCYIKFPKPNDVRDFMAMKNALQLEESNAFEEGISLKAIQITDKKIVKFEDTKIEMRDQGTQTVMD